MGLFDAFLLNSKQDGPPQYDIAVCQNTSRSTSIDIHDTDWRTCGWSGPVSDCDSGIDGSWEEGYYAVHICPKCGGVIDEYDFSEKVEAEYIKYMKEKSRADRLRILSSVKKPQKRIRLKKP